MDHRCNRDCRRHGCAFVSTAEVPATAAEAVNAKEKAAVPLFYLDQNQSGATPYEVTAEQAAAMKAAGRGKFINRGKAFQLCESAPVGRSFVPSESYDSTASISVSEMLANAGVPASTPGADLPRHLAQRARQKVQAIGGRLDGTFDRKATLAFGAPSWPVYAANVSLAQEA